MKHKILSGSIEEVRKQLNDLEIEWDIEVVSTSMSDFLYIIIIKIKRPKR
tara:strand:+ start:124 stop:273 length:150 start_codon:yes stop_codon:yes gene_type:complete